MSNLTPRRSPARTPSRRRTSCAPQHRASVPTSVSQVSGKKYMSAEAEWQTDASRKAGFACLKFKLNEPQYYLYSYRAAGCEQGR